MMAGVKPARSRGRYVSAGYMAGGQQYSAGRIRQDDARAAQQQGVDLYIADVPAGSAQENLRDLNRPGYRSDRPWRDEPDPVPVLEERSQPREAQAEQRQKASGANRRTAGKRKRRQGLLERMANAAARDKKGATVCVLLAVVCLMMSSVWAQKMVAGVEIQRMIDSYQVQTRSFEQENESLSQQLEMARSGERIRNLAQNELGMLRPERAQTETIYIQAPDSLAQETVQENEAPQMEWLDFLLGLLSVFHIGE